MNDRLTDTEIAEALTTLAGWTREGDALVRTFERDGFDGAIAFVNDVARLANAADHHPDIAIAWNRVTLRLTSHDAHGITRRDVDLARRLADAI